MLTWTDNKSIQNKADMMYVKNKLAWMVLRRQRSSLVNKDKYKGRGVSRGLGKNKCHTQGIGVTREVHSLEVGENNQRQRERYQAEGVSNVVDNGGQLHDDLELRHGFWGGQVGAGIVVGVLLPSSIGVAEPRCILWSNAKTHAAKNANSF